MDELEVLIKEQQQIKSNIDNYSVTHKVLKI